MVNWVASDLGCQRGWSLKLDLKGTSKNYPFRLPERGADLLLQSFSRHGINGPWYF